MPLFIDIGCFILQTDGLVQKIQLGTLCSAKGLKEIGSEDACKRAAKKLGLEWDNSWNGPNEFPACLHAEDGRIGRNKVYFNTSPNPTRTNLKSTYAAICEGNQKIHNIKSYD